MTPDQHARKLQIKIWKRFPDSIKIWIMIANYFMAVLPGITFAVQNVHVKDSNTSKNAEFQNETYITTLITHLMVIVLLAVQIFLKSRFMSLKLVQTQIVGNIFSIALVLMSTSKWFVKAFSFKIGNTTFNQGLMFLALLLCGYVLLFLYGISPISELLV